MVKSGLRNVNDFDDNANSCRLPIYKDLIEGWTIGKIGIENQSDDARLMPVRFIKEIRAADELHPEDRLLFIYCFVLKRIRRTKYFDVFVTVFSTPRSKGEPGDYHRSR
uniref:Uncharacterized protein n=1 Tax=Romanomermis culicivorax TaxID=13658 RepID=A0A915I6D3_ROMCU